MPAIRVAAYPAARIVFQMVSGRQLFRHPSRLDRLYVMEQLMTYHLEHQTPPHEILRDLEQAALMIPKADHAAEAAPLKRIYQRSQRSRKKEAEPIGAILVAVLARLGVSGLDLMECEAQESEASASETNPR